LFVFFFQAEDGIRDPLVTGVQTCALPIYCGDELANFPGVLEEALEAVEHQERRSAARGAAKLLAEFGRCRCNHSKSSGSFRHERSEEHTSELQSRVELVCRLLLETENAIA